MTRAAPNGEGASKWEAACFIPDPPVPGALAFLYEALHHFDVQIFSTRSHQEGGIVAMKAWLRHWAKKELPNYERAGGALYSPADTVIKRLCGDEILWPTTKPPATVSIDDRAITFEGTWPAIETLKAFKPWNKRP